MPLGLGSEFDRQVLRQPEGKCGWGSPSKPEQRDGENMLEGLAGNVRQTIISRI